MSVILAKGGGGALTGHAALISSANAWDARWALTVGVRYGGAVRAEGRRACERLGGRLGQAREGRLLSGALIIEKIAPTGGASMPGVLLADPRSEYLAELALAAFQNLC